MIGDSYDYGSGETRSALGDLTNLPSKRGISPVLGDLVLKSGVGFDETVIHGGESVPFSKRLCLVVENLAKEKSRASAEKECDINYQYSLKDKSSSGISPANCETEDIATVVGKESKKIKYASGVLDVGERSAKGDSDTILEMVAGDGNALRASISIPSCSETGNKDYGQGSNMPSNAIQSDITREGLVSCVSIREIDDSERLAMRNCKSTEGPKLLNSQSFRSFEMSRCSTIDGNERGSHNAGADLLKACSCSFCLKAAYIWSDLHYQDLKGRIVVLKKSQKEASVFLQKNARGKQIDSHRLANSSMSVKLESDLMAQWRSLFLNMGDIFGRESNQLQSSFVTMKDLRENCKMDLERATGIHQDKS